MDAEMSDPAKNPFDLLVDQIRATVREEVKAALANRPKQLLYDYDQAAAILNIPVTWLSERVRKKAIPHKKLGHYVRFAPADLDDRPHLVRSSRAGHRLRAARARDANAELVMGATI